MNVQLIPDDFRNSTFEENLELLRAVYPKIYESVKDHKSKSHRLCLNPDGTPNIVNMAEKTLLYPASAEEIDTLNECRVLGMARQVNFSKTYFLQDKSFPAQNSPIQNRAYSELLRCTPMSIRQVEDPAGRADYRIQERDITYLPFVRAYGIGLGTQLLKLLKERTVIHLSIIEPDIDLFFSSLFVIPWRILHRYFSIANRSMSLIVGDTPEESMKRESAYVRETFPLMISNVGRLIMINDDAVLKRLLSAQEKEDEVNYNSSSAGWYDDQKTGLYNSLCNVREQGLFYVGKRTTEFLRVFVVGSGPSLDDSIAYIRQHVDHAIIFACGSAISPLLAAGIIPDFHVIQERLWEEDWVYEPESSSLLKQVRLLKLNVVSPSNDPNYKETYIFQKFMDPGSALLGTDFPSTQGVNPTVTNAGIAFACELGADEIFLFGVDYGSPAGTGTWHTANTINDKENMVVLYEDEKVFEIKGNFDDPVDSTPILSWSLKVSETLIGRHKQIKWINVGDGASIAGTVGYRTEELPDLSSTSITKDDITKEIAACFSDEYRWEDIFQNFGEAHRDVLKRYLDSLRIFHKSKVATRDDIMNVLAKIYVAADIGLDKANFMPSSLLNGGIKRLLDNIYLQSSLAASDPEAASFFEKAIVALEEYYSSVLSDVDRLVQSAKNRADIIN